MTEQLTHQLKNLPNSPGIYKYFDADNTLIYVGKAINLKNRVRSYFSGHDHSPKTQVLVSKIDHLETIVVQSEVDALLLETNLIKEYRPRYNIILKDDKSHLYIKITLYEDLPRVSTCRQTDIAQDPKATYFGPFPSSATVKQTLRYLRRVFPYMARHQPPLAGRRRPPQSYFYYNMPLGPVDAVIDQKAYRQQIFQLIHFLEGKRLQVADELTRAMKAAAKRLDFEQAGLIKQQLDGITYVSQASIRPELYLANPELMADKRQAGLQQLAEALSPYFVDQELGPSDYSPLRRIECSDISNTSGQQAVGSMVVFEDGQAEKSHYRKFRIKRSDAPNDFAMLQEVLRRRFKRLATAQSNQSDSKADASFSARPDLIIVDGGKGQLSSALIALAELSLDIPIAGLTKREEELVVAQKADLAGQALVSKGVQHTDRANSETRYSKLETHSLKANRSAAHASFARTADEATTQTKMELNYVTIRLARGSEALFLIQRIRDEAHRFAITYHRKLRDQQFLKPGKA
jgi:excinuclease ABC subunit C